MAETTVTIDHAMALAIERHKAGQLPEAEKLYRAVLGAAPQHPLANHNLGKLAIQVGRPDAALPLLQAAVSAAPDHAGFRNSVGEALRLLDRHEEALAEFDKAIALDPHDPSAHNNRGIALDQLKRFDQARASYRRAIDLRPDYVNALANLGVSFGLTGENEAAIENYRAALAIAPTHLDAAFGLMRSLVELGRLDEAIATAKMLLPMTAQPGFPIERLFARLVEAGAFDLAREMLERALERDPADSVGARVMLAHLDDRRPTIARASDAQINRLYAAKAQTWDGVPEYRAARLVAQALEPHLEPGADVLDAGCGTGLVGARLGARYRLSGVDLSGPMLEKALSRQIYNALHQGDLLAHLAGHPGEFDAIACAATLIHFGDLAAPLEAAAKALRPGGVFALTLFPYDADPDGFAAHPDIGLAANGIFAHGRGYVVAAAAAAGLRVVSLTDEVHEHHRGEPRMGLLAVLRKAG